jgi:hypothetical protein
MSYQYIKLKILIVTFLNKITTCPLNELNQKMTEK